MKSDQELQNDVKHALASLAESVQDDIAVSATAGVVTLTGSVPGDAEMWEVDAAVRALDGVRDVRNKTMVIPEPARQPDGDIAKPWFP